MEDYRIVADEIAADVEAGRLRPGDRLPPQRRFARERGIANSTAARVYGELVRRGVVVGEVGRGTFVRATRPPLEPALAEPGGATIDLELNFAVLPEQSALVAKAMESLLRDDVLTAALRPGGPRTQASTDQGRGAHLPTKLPQVTVCPVSRDWSAFSRPRYPKMGVSGRTSAGTWPPPPSEPVRTVWNSTR